MAIAIMAKRFLVSEEKASERLHPFGHEIIYRFSLRSAALIEEKWTYSQNYQSSCDISPTSWRIHMFLDKNPHSPPKHLIVSGTARLKRTDRVNISVRLLFWVSIRHPKLKEHFPTPKVDQMTLPGDEIIVNIANIVPYEYNHLLNEELSMAVHFQVRNCHQVVKTDPEKPGGEMGGEMEKKLHCSKM